MILGAWIVVLPFLGFPSAWIKFLFVVTGLVIIGIAYSIKVNVKREPGSNMPFVEHKS
jgi:hypothetical protein